MAQQLYFSRDTRMFIQFRNPADNTETAAKLGAGVVWEVPVLDGYSFSQTTNTSEITLSSLKFEYISFNCLCSNGYPSKLI